MISDLCSFTSSPDFLGLFDFNNSVVTIFILYGYIVSIFFSGVLLVFAFNSFLKNKTMLGYSFVSLMASYLFLSLNELVLWTAAPHAVLKISWFLVFPMEFLFFLSLGLICFSIIKPVFNPTVVHNHIRTALIAAVFTPLWVNIQSYNRMSCEGIQGPLIYVFYACKVLLFVYLLYTLYRSQKDEASADLKRAKVVLSIALIACFTVFVGIDIFTQLTDNFNFDTTRVFGVVVVVSTILWLMTASEKKEQEKTYFIEKFGPAQAFITLLFIADIVLLFFKNKEGVSSLYQITTYSNVAFTFMVFLFLSFQQNQKISLNKLNARLIFLDQQKNQFLSFATHQLKAPLTAMKWGMETLKEMGYTEAEQPQRTAIINKIYSTTDDLIHTVGDFLDISKIEQGGLVLKKEEFIWSEYIASLAGEFRATATNKGLDFIIDIPKSTELVFADKTKLRQVVVNLVDNAIKYTPTGRIIVKVEKKGSLLHMVVSDTGPGISEEELPKLFSKFTRGAAGATINGSGLGLFLAKKIMELHNGDIWATSEGLGFGSQFHITIPIYFGPPTTPEPAPQPESPALQPAVTPDIPPAV